MALAHRGIISLDKKNLPPYMFKVNLAAVVFFAAWFVVCLPVIIAVGCIYGEEIITYAVMIAGFAIFLIGLVILVIISRKAAKLLIAERTAEFEEEYSDMPLEEAEKRLIEEGVIRDGGFIIEDDVFGEKTVPFDGASLVIDVVVWSAVNFAVNIRVFEENEPVAVFPLDRALFNFIDKKDLYFYDEFEAGRFQALKSNKEMFCRMALGYKF